GSARPRTHRWLSAIRPAPPFGRCSWIGRGTDMKAIYGLYADGMSAQQAVNRLRANGVAERAIVGMSAEAMEDFEFGHMESRTRIWWIACLGGLLGMATAFGLAWLTEVSWPINV